MSNSSNKLPDGTYLKTQEAVDALGISEATLYRRKAEGWFVQGVHFVTTGPFKRSSFFGTLMNVERSKATGMRPSRFDDQRIFHRIEMACGGSAYC